MTALETKEFHDRTDFCFRKPYVKVKRNSHGTCHGVADFIEKDEAQYP